MKFDGTINLGHVLTLFVLLVTVISAFYTLDRRLAVLENTVADALVRIDKTVDRIEAKLDLKQDRAWP